MSAKKPATKPRTPEAAQKRRAFTVRMSPEQASLIERAAEQEALDEASWIRMVAVKAARAALGTKAD